MSSPYPYLQGLNDQQRQAVTTTEGPVMVIAGPGSGKTRVLTLRIAHLINTGIPPWQILALTFTNKAAREMKERISKEVGSAVRKVWAGTFHSVFAKILRMEANLIGYPSDFTIYDTEDSKSLIRSIIKDMGLKKDQYNVGAVRNRISSAKSKLITPKAYEKDVELIQQDRLNNMPYIFEIYKKYMSRCTKAGAMDFDDLLYFMFKLLYQNPENVVEKYRKRFQFIHVDEFQDTNFLQYAILKKLALYPGSPENICIVGDDAQSIYAFRGATIDNILTFEKDFPDVQVYKLEQNYRSTPHIISAANKLITQNQKQIKKTIWTEKTIGNKIKLIKAITDNEEGRLVADSILEIKNRLHFPSSEIAILYRTNAQSRSFEEALRRKNIAYKIFGGLSFYQRKEVKDILAYFRFTLNRNDEEAFKRIVNFPKRAIGATTVSKIIGYAVNEDIPLWQALKECPFPQRARTAINKFLKIIVDCAKKVEKSDASESANFIFKTSGLYENLKKDNTIEGQTRFENAIALIDAVKEFVEDDELEEGEDVGEEKTLSSFLQEVALYTDQDEKIEESDYVTLMTVHAAKGLEFSAVYLVGLEENLFPSFMSMGSPQEIEEERRLFYVAITRAKEFLSLSYANSRYQYGQQRYNDQSRFLEEIPVEVFEEIPQKHQSDRVVNTRSIVRGNFRTRSPQANYGVKVNLESFTPSPSYKIQVGMEVLHTKFGKGKVLSIDGAAGNKVATIYFSEIDNSQRRIALKFAKLQILEV